MTFREYMCWGVVGRWMHRRGWRGVVLPLPVVVVLYWLPGAPDRAQVAVGGWRSMPRFARFVAWPGCVPYVEHERTHVDQVRRLGRLRFILTYMWQVARYGYRKAPLEIEAYEAQRRVEQR